MVGHSECGVKWCNQTIASLHYQENIHIVPVVSIYNETTLHVSVVMATQVVDTMRTQEKPVDL